MPKITAVYIGIPKQITFSQMYHYLISGYYKYEGYDKTMKGQKYILTKQVPTYPSEIYDHTLVRRL